MIKLEKTEVVGLKHAIRGMRNPMNSWDQSDSQQAYIDNGYEEAKIDILSVGDKDLDLMKRLKNAGPDHRKFMRMMVVYVDITAPLYWWKEFDTYKVGTVANSCSTMHKLSDKEFELGDFSHEHLLEEEDPVLGDIISMRILSHIIAGLNRHRKLYIKTKDKKYWWQMIQLLPSSYNQKRTVMLNYEVLRNMYHNRKNHKLDEWHGLCDWIDDLPYSELITNKEKMTADEALKFASKVDDVIKECTAGLGISDEE